MLIRVNVYLYDVHFSVLFLSRFLRVGHVGFVTCTVVGIVVQVVQFLSWLCQPPSEYVCFDAKFPVD